MRSEVTTYHLEMTSRAELCARRPDQPDFRIRRAELPIPEFSRFLYWSVGSRWYWLDRLVWNYQEWLSWLDRPELETWVAYLGGTPVGFFELELQKSLDVEIVTFGLLPHFVGRRLGGPLLTAAVERAWDMGARRVWVHTCTLDHKSALGNYLARGFRIFKTESESKDLPERPPEPWPGAGARE